MSANVVVPAGGAEVPAGVDAADLDDLVGDGPEERPVVGGDEVAEAASRSSRSSQTMPGRSRWLVGSSSSSRSGSRASSRARASRFRQPPERVSAGWSGSAKPDLREGDGGPRLALVVLEVVVGEGGEHDVAGGLAGGEGVVLRQVADAGAAAGGDGAGVGGLAAGEEPEQGGLARPRWAR